MSHSVDEQLSFLRSLIQARSFCDSTLRFLESLLVSKDVKSLIEVRSSLTHLLRSESLSVIRSIAAKTVHDKLLVLDFFVRAFSLVGDQQSCLALRYEALVMREHKSASCQWLQVSPAEWLSFVENAVHNGFHAVAEKACEIALSCLGNNDDLKHGRDPVPENLKAVISEITRLRNCAMASVASRSDKKPRHPFARDLLCNRNVKCVYLGADGRVSKKENNRAAKTGLNLHRKTMSSKHFFQKRN
ncbi:hypothetical protein JHK87_049143 [Glycine soja]|nr:hypothetical protein JHK87_049143 [Glycine soja]